MKGPATTKAKLAFTSTFPPDTVVDSCETPFQRGCQIPWRGVQTGNTSATRNRRSMNEYEVTYILRPSLEESEVDERANAIAEILKSQGGQVMNVERLGRKRLAYEIKDVREGHYVVMQFKSDPAASKELERQLKLHEDVLRALVVRLDAKMLAHM